METQNEDSRRSSSPPVPLDVIIEILLRLPAKSVARFRCVSKLWSTSTTTPSFIKSFTIHSSARASILSVKMETGKRGFFSLPHQQDPIHPFTHVENHEMMLPKGYVYPSHYDTFLRGFIFDIQDSVQGLVSFENSDDIIICNPTLRQRIALPPPRISKPFASLLGYDPIADEHKVLCMSLWNKRDDPLILTLGIQQPWRKTKSSPIHHLMNGWRCINGVLYYYGVDLSIVSFDVRSEKFLIIKKPDWHMFDVPLPHPKHSLISYKGRLAWIFDGLDLSSVLWILEDAEKQEWSSPIVFDVPFHRVPPNYICGLLRLSGDTGDDELIYTPAAEPIFDYLNTPESRAEPLLAFYYDLKTKITRTVSYEGNKVSSWSDFVCFPNHIESLKPLNQAWNDKNYYYLS